MIAHHCPCGQPIDVCIEPDINGFDYTVAFTVPGTGAPQLQVRYCPECDQNLYNALKTGDMKEQTAATRDKTCS